MAVALLWHLHQPEYRDPETGIPVMPWTRLHALRGYLDLLTETVEQEVPWTLNLVPGLWEQLAYYAQGGTDEHLDLSRIPADALSDAQRTRIEQTFPCGNPTLRDLPRYREIEARLADGERLDRAGLRDLQVLSTLAWTGSIARRDHPLLGELLTKGAAFDEEDKAGLWAVQEEILAGFPSLLERLAATRGASISTTPLHHPILPLLVDLGHAARSVGNPPSTSLQVPDHALLQLTLGRQRIEAATGRGVTGLWPSEGAVSPEILPLVAEAGFRWLATDEGLLARSERSGSGEGGWDLGHGLVGFFRDRALSDRVGFDYAHWKDPKRAAADFLRRASCPHGVRLVALDGENPWEAFRDAGRDFRARLIEGLRTEGIALDEAAERPVVGRVEQLATGSWIGADLEIWAGSEEDHAAWALLAEAVEATAGHPEAVPHLLAAEGSDWFWWYGPEFETPFAPTFDAAFRGHLRAAWCAAGLEVPENLARPITSRHGDLEPPARPLDPSLGEPGWFGAGRWTPAQGAMAHGTARTVELGWDGTGRLWLRGPEGLALAVDGEPVTLAASGVCLPGTGPRALVLEGQRVVLFPVDWAV